MEGELSIELLRLFPRLAVLIFVATPLVIWLWSLIEQKGPQDAIKRIMFGYWQVDEALTRLAQKTCLQFWHTSLSSFGKISGYDISWLT